MAIFEMSFVTFEKAQLVFSLYADNSLGIFQSPGCVFFSWFQDADVTPRTGLHGVMVRFKSYLTLAAEIWVLKVETIFVSVALKY